MATTISLVCPKCGITKKSGKLSCCGLGGSWFGNCGSAGDIKLDHTWYEGLRSCKARTQSKTVIDHQLNRAQQENNNPSNGAGTVNSGAIVVAPEARSPTSVLMSGAPPIIALAHTPANTSPASATVAIDRKPIATAVPRSYMSTRDGSVNVVTAAPVHDLVTSQGRKQILDIHVHVTLSLSVTTVSLSLFI